MSGDETTSITRSPAPWQRLLMFCGALTLVVLVIWRIPVNGWSSLFWLVSSISIAVLRAPYERQTAQNEVVHTEAASTERILLGLVAIGSTGLPLLHLTTGLLSSLNYRLPLWFELCGVVGLFGGLWLFWKSHHDLGRNWSVTTELRRDHELTTSGVYRTIRHPMYSAIMVLFALQAVFVQNWIAGFSGLATFVLMVVLRVPYEEAMMRSRFGDAYDVYCRQTGRLIPKLSRVAWR